MCTTVVQIPYLEVYLPAHKAECWPPFPPGLELLPSQKSLQKAKLSYSPLNSSGAGGVRETPCRQAHNGQAHSIYIALHTLPYTENQDPKAHLKTDKGNSCKQPLKQIFHAGHDITYSRQSDLQWTQIYLKT